MNPLASVAYTTACLILLTLAGAPAGAGDEPQPSAAAQSPIPIDVYKTPTCGCCTVWVDHLEAEGFEARVFQQPNLSFIKKRHDIPPRYASCHTAVTSDGYIFEGHIPAGIIKRFLSEPPADAIGLTVPGMPVGSPGMEAGDKFMPYQVLLLRESGEPTVYASVTTPEEQYADD